MAKLKLKELALELGISDDDAKKIMTDSGRDAKYTRFTKASALLDEDIDFIRQQAGSASKKADSKKPAKSEEKDSAENAKKPAKVKSAEKPVEKAEPKAQPKEEVKTEGKKETEQAAKPAVKEEAKKAAAPAATPAAAPAAKPEAKPARPANAPAGQAQKAADQNAPKKKKAIIFVNNSQTGGNRPPQRNGQQAGGNRPVRPGGQHQIIKPTIKPGAIQSTPKPQPQQPVKKKPAPQPQAGEQTKPIAAEQEQAAGNQQKAQQSQTIQTLQPKGDLGREKARDERQNRSSDQGRSARNEGQGSRNAGGRNFSSPDRPSRNDGGSQGGQKKGKGGGGFSDGGDKEGQKGSDKRRLKDGGRKGRNNQIFDEENENTSRRNRAGKFIKPEKKPVVEEEKIKVITIPETITIKDLADKMKIQPAAIIKKLFMQGQVLTVNQEVDFETAENIAIEYEIICEKEEVVDVIEELLKEDEEKEDQMVPRPPVICVMGHVDHGKTSLLDAIRETNVTDREAGGITQHIGAYTVKINGQSITFLDTPGHEAFTAMRMRGANSTDIAILVVAADDGVMPQTVEAINHAKAAGIEIIVAVNKIDKPGANVDRVKQELTEYELIPTDWGGSTEFVPVSAKSREGIDDLLETILLTAEILELKANPNRMGRGLVIEAELDKGRGPVATVLVQKGTLHVGDFISAGVAHGRVRAMVDDKGRRVKEAKPSTPVEILGLSDVPGAGEIFIAHESDKEAKSFADTFEAQNRVKKLEETKSKMSLDDLFSQIQAGNLKELNLIVKADVQGSVEAVKQSLMKLSNDEVVVKCIHGGVGAINESDVVLASASSAIIIGFNVRPDAMAKATAEREGVDVRLYKVIYQAIEDVEAAMKGMLDPIFEERVIGHAEVRQIFKASAIGNIAGSYVLDGRFERDCKIRITREGEQIYEGQLQSLKRFKDDVKEVKAGFECGLVFDGFDQMQELDVVEAYIMVEVPR